MNRGVGVMNTDTRYRGLRFLAGAHNVISGLVLGVAILVGGAVVVAGILGVAMIGTGGGFYTDPRLAIAAGVVFITVGGFVAALIFGLGQFFRAVADMADNSHTVLFVLAGLRDSPVAAPKVSRAED